MYKLLVNSPDGQQQIIIVGEGGNYFDAARVLWDERYNGDLPDNITLGKMVFDEGNLKTLADYLPEHTAFIAAQQAKIDQKSKKDQLDTDTKGDSDLVLLRDMSGTQIDSWFAVNIKTVNDASKLLKKVVKSLIKQNLL